MEVLLKIAHFKGIIIRVNIFFSSHRAEQIGYALMKDEYVKPTGTLDGRGGFFKRRGLRASMSMKGKPIIKDHWDEVIFSKSCHNTGKTIKYSSFV